MLLPLARRLAKIALLAVALSLLAAACGRGGGAAAPPPQAVPPGPDGALDVLVASSLASAVEEAAALLRARDPGVTVRVEAGGSVTLARRVAELSRPCDLLLTADAEVMVEVLLPEGAARGWVAFAGGSVAVACVSGTALSRDLAALPPGGRMARLAAPGLRIARTSPEGAPIGARTLLVFALAEKRLGPEGIAARLLANAPDSLVRPLLPVTEALVRSGEADACLDYPASAREKGLAVFALPPEIDLSDPARAASYAEVSVEVPGDASGKNRRVAGAPVRYAAAIPASAHDPARAAALLALLCSPEGRAILSRHGHRPLTPPERHGDAPKLDGP